MIDLVAHLEKINLLKDVFVPAAAALFAVWVATRKFRKEQIWKEKYAAYQSVLRSLESIAYWASETQSGTLLHPTTGTRNTAEEYASAQREVLRHVALGPLLLSTDFCAQLERFRDDLYTERFNASEDHHDDPREEEWAWGEHAGKVYTIVDRHLPGLIRLARDDLGA